MITHNEHEWTRYYYMEGVRLAKEYPSRGRITMTIKSIPDIYNFLMEQASLRSPENDEAGVLIQTAAYLIKQIEELE